MGAASRPNEPVRQETTGRLAERPPLRVLDAQGSDLSVTPSLGSAKVCYGLCLFSDSLAAEGSEPHCFGLSLKRDREPEAVFQRLGEERFRFACTGKAVHLLQPPSTRTGKVFMPHCQGLEILTSERREAAAEPGAAAAAARGRPLAPSEVIVGRPAPPTVSPKQPDEGASRFAARFLRTSGKIARRMEENGSFVLEKLFGRRRD